MKTQKTKYIFISGGVISGLGKGITTASIGSLLQSAGYSVTNLKCENYLNLDSGNINPVEHGDVFLCEDGLEADLDLGTYERFLDYEVGFDNFTTMGQIYTSVIKKASELKYNGKTVQAIPFLPNEVIERIKKVGKNKDIVLVELGGTVGEYQNIIYYEAYRIMKLRHPEDVIHIHITYLPAPPHINELKSKPTQISVKLLNSMGIQPDFIVARAEKDIDEKRKQKIAFYCNLNTKDIISNKDVKTIYEIPILFKKQKFGEKIQKKLNLKVKQTNAQKWEKLIKKINTLDDKKSINISIIAKYIKTGDYELKDSYNSLLEAISHASWALGIKTNITFIDAEKLEKDKNNKEIEKLKSSDAIIVPIGWGSRGVEGKIKAINIARENKIPFLGLCYGMQLACIEFARNKAGLKNAHTTEVDPNTPYPIIHDIPFSSKYQKIKAKNASMRLGGYDCVLKKNTLAFSIYKKHKAFKDESKNLISERHRHRYEFNNKYREILQKHGLIISGTSPDDEFVEMIELSKKDHPFFIATQGHPEYKSKPTKPHPIFIEFLKAGLNFKKSH